MKNILFRTEASATIGMGHFVRCLSLAKMLDSDFSISFLLNKYDAEISLQIMEMQFDAFFLADQYNNPTPINEESLLVSADIVVLDGYNFSPDFQKSIKLKKKKLVCIDDIHAAHFYADVIINISDSVSEKDYLAEPYTKFCFGSRYALLREPFLKSSRKPARLVASIKETVVIMGGADVNNITLKILKAIIPCAEIEKIHLVIGTFNPHEHSLNEYIKENASNCYISLHKNLSATQLNSLFSNCQLVVCPASGTCLEAAAVGMGIISGYTAENQLGMLNALNQMGCVLNLGSFDKIPIDEITRIIQEYCKNNTVNEMITHQKKFIDGQSPSRLLDIFNQLSNEVTL